MLRKTLLSALLVALTLVVFVQAAALLTTFPSSLLIPLVLMAVATVLFYVWA